MEGGWAVYDNDGYAEEARWRGGAEAGGRGVGWIEGIGEEKEDGGGGARRGLGDGGNGTTPVTWNNDALVRVSSGFDEKKWISANYIAKITGLLYNDITGARRFFRSVGVAPFTAKTSIGNIVWERRTPGGVGCTHNRACRNH